jgi:hypothetical protein
MRAVEELPTMRGYRPKRLGGFGVVSNLGKPRHCDVVNVGAAGTLVVRKPVSRTKFLAELRRKLPFQAAVVFC